MNARVPGGGPEIHRTPETLVPLQDAWRDLLAADPDGSYFMTPDWALSWWEASAARHLGQGETAVWRDGTGRVEALAPLLRTRHRLHPRLPLTVPCLTLLGAGPGAADHLGIPALAHRRDDVRRWLGERARRGTIWLPGLDSASAAVLPRSLRPVARTGVPRVDLTAGPGALGSARLRQNLRRYRRKLDAAGVTFRWLPPKELTGEVLDDVLRLHRLRAESIGRATHFTAERRPLHLRLIERGAADRGPCALLAEREGAAVGAVYGFWWQRTFCYYQTGWDPRFAPLRLGLQLVAESIRQAYERGAAVFDFLRGDEDYKYRFGAMDRYDTDHLAPRGLSGALLHAKVRVQRRSRQEPR